MNAPTTFQPAADRADSALPGNAQGTCPDPDPHHEVVIAQVASAVVQRVADAARSAHVSARRADDGRPGSGTRGAAVDVDQVARDELRARAPLLAEADVARLVQRVVARLGGLGALGAVLADEAVTDVLVNGDGSVWVERSGALSRTGVHLEPESVTHLIERIVIPLGLRIDRVRPVVDARLPDGSRVHAIIPPLAVDGPCVAIRRFGVGARGLAEFCTPAVEGLLRWLVQSRQNVIVSGGTGAGKTSLLNALCGAIPEGERIITIEDAAELRLPGEHVIRLEARTANAEGVGAVSIRELVRNALRMRPDRIIVGESRGGEALDVLQAMNTGHEGSLSTVHANGPADALRRLETMVLMGDVGLPLSAVREQVVSAVDAVVQVARGAGGKRRVVSVAEPSADLDPRGAIAVRQLADGDGVLRAPSRLARVAVGVGPSPTDEAGRQLVSPCQGVLTLPVHPPKEGC